MAYGQTGSGKTHTMFGPAGCLTEASVHAVVGGTGAGANKSAIPYSWGLFPRAVLTLMQDGQGGHQTQQGQQGQRPLQNVLLHASAIEVYHENVFDLLNERQPLTIGSNKLSVGVRVSGKADLGANNQKALNGMHPAACECHTCFREKERLKKAQEEARMQRAREAEEVRAAKVLGKQGPGTATESDPGEGRRSSAGLLGTSTSIPAQTRGASVVDDSSFSTVGEQIIPLRDAMDVARFARTVEATRTAKSHALNERSSRSHCLVKVHVMRVSDGGERRLRTTLLFVDLAGSERIERTGADRAEAATINSSLSALGRVIKALGAARGSSGSTHIPYRDAALTMLLRDSFGGKSATSVVINVAGESEHAEESICSLRFGERMSVVKNKATVVVSTTADSLGKDMASLRAILEKKRLELQRMDAQGHGGGFVPGAPKTEVLSLTENMEKLEKAEAEIRDCMTQIAERKSQGQGEVSSLQQTLKFLRERAEILGGVVERQQTIKTLWAYPTPGYARKLAEVKELEGRVMLAALDT